MTYREFLEHELAGLLAEIDEYGPARHPSCDYRIDEIEAELAEMEGEEE